MMTLAALLGSSTVPCKTDNTSCNALEITLWAMTSCCRKWLWTAETPEVSANSQFSAVPDFTFCGQEMSPRIDTEVRSLYRIVFCTNVIPGLIRKC